MLLVHVNVKKGHGGPCVLVFILVLMSCSDVLMKILGHMNGYLAGESLYSFKGCRVPCLFFSEVISGKC